MTGATLDAGVDLDLSAGLTLNQSAGSIAGIGNITVNGDYNWSGGSLDGTGLLTTNGVSNLSGAGTRASARNWLNTGTVNLNGPGFTSNGAGFTNDGVFNLVAAAAIGNGAGADVFLNNATLNVNADLDMGAGQFDNAGSLNIGARQTLTLNSPGSDTGACR